MRITLRVWSPDVFGARVISAYPAGQKKLARMFMLFGHGHDVFRVHEVVGHDHGVPQLVAVGDEDGYESRADAYHAVKELVLEESPDEA